MRHTRQGERKNSLAKALGLADLDAHQTAALFEKWNLAFGKKCIYHALFQNCNSGTSSGQANRKGLGKGSGRPKALYCVRSHDPPTDAELSEWAATLGGTWQPLDVSES